MFAKESWSLFFLVLFIAGQATSQVVVPSVSSQYNADAGVDYNQKDSIRRQLDLSFLLDPAALLNLFAFGLSGGALVQGLVGKSSISAQSSSLSSASASLARISSSITLQSTSLVTLSITASSLSAKQSSLCVVSSSLCAVQSSIALLSDIDMFSLAIPAAPVVLDVAEVAQSVNSVISQLSVVGSAASANSCP